MNDDLIKLDPEGLDEQGKLILTEGKTIEEALSDVKDAMKLLEGWQSPNKEKYEVKVNKVLPKMLEMVESIKMFGNVAISASEKIKARENVISTRIDEDLEG